ncbi:hypothetical protein LCGC14_2450340 [marine sediment metagenome]|uniref:Uncharacterized protein n=1 Tax=marine sediment metagenome TaxID=412755 RepID=A0A0F9BGQ8_9ZZZZ
MRFNIEVSHLKPVKVGNPLAIFWPGKVKWYKYPRLMYPGERGRFLGGFNLANWIVRVNATWRPS